MTVTRLISELHVVLISPRLVYSGSLVLWILDRIQTWEPCLLQKFNIYTLLHIQFHFQSVKNRKQTQSRRLSRTYGRKRFCEKKMRISKHLINGLWHLSSNVSITITESWALIKYLWIHKGKQVKFMKINTNRTKDLSLERFHWLA